MTMRLLPLHPQRTAGIAAALAVLLLTGCASKPARETSTTPPQVESMPARDQVATVVPPTEPPRTDIPQDERAAREALEREGMVIRFDYDSAQIRAEYQPLLASHARFANRFGQLSLRLEGHTDERGSREYNIGLGERRAQAVKRALELQGVPASRIVTVSYGEERPEATGTGDASWSQNRRVEIRYSP